MDVSNIRNFAIIAHIDHGKSTLADRFLELTGAIDPKKMKAQILDQMDLEREKGITIKLQPVRMDYTLEGREYIYNLIDTPGHVDFTYEVSRSLVVCDGVLLLVDATQGVEAQTIANLHLAQNLGLKIIPVINKIDAPAADIEKTKEEILTILENDLEPSLVSAKTGEGVTDLLARIADDIPAPVVNSDQLKVMIFDSWFDAFQGAIAAVKVVSGKIVSGEKLHLVGSDVDAWADEVGFFRPDKQKKKELTAGEIGYIATGLKSVKDCRVGDTVVLANQTKDIKGLPGFRKIHPVVFSEFYPEDASEYSDLSKALDRLGLNDAALTMEPTTSKVLGFGFRLGFLGLLHLEIIKERLNREFQQKVVITNPTVNYTIHFKDGRIKDINNPSQFPDTSQVEKIEQPMVKAEIIVNQKYLGKVMEVTDKFYGQYQTMEHLSKDQVMLTYLLPLAKVIVGFYDSLKGVSSGYASLNYTPSGKALGDVVKLDLVVAGQPEEAFGQIVLRQDAERVGRALVKKLKNLLPPQLWTVPLQACIGSKVIARENIRSRGKDVTAGLYGGDRSRKDKLLKKQKAGKKRLAAEGRLEIPPDVYLEVLK